MDWTLTLIGSVFGSIIISIIANLLTDPVKLWVTNRSLISKRKRVSELEKDLARITQLYQDERKLQYEITYAVTISGTFMIFGLAAGVLGTASLVAANNHPFFQNTAILWVLIAVLGEIGGGIFLITGQVTAINHMNTMRKLMRFDKYKQDTENRINELLKKAEIKHI